MMSSNELWKVQNVVQPPTPTMGRFTAGNLPRVPHNMSQDEPIDFSQKSDSTSSDTPKQREANFKTLSYNGYHKNGHDRSSRGYTSLEHLYHVRNASDPLAKRQNGSRDAGGIVQHVPDRMAESVLPLPIQSPDSFSRIGNCNSTVASYRGSPSSHPSNACRETSKSPDEDVHMSPLSSPDDQNFTKGQKRPSEGNGQEMDICNNEEEPRLPLQINGHGFPNGRLSAKYLDASSQDVGTTSDSVSMNPVDIARMLNGTNVRNATELPKLTIPITNPMMVRKTNGSSPGIASYHGSYSPPVGMEDPSRAGALVPMPNPWEVLSSPYAHHGLDDKKSPRAVRPFKAFGNDILNSCNPDILASVGLAGRSSTVTFDKFIKFRTDYMDPTKNDVSDVTTADSTRHDHHNPNGSSSPESVRRANHDSNDSSPSPRMSGHNDESQLQQQLSDPGRRKGNRFPDHQKDPAYWERRRKNNEAAKRSRDARRRKEDALAMTAKELLEDKMRMAMHLTFQMKEMQKLEEENRFLKEREVTLQNYLFHLESRCRECTKCSSTRNPSEKRPPVVPNQM